MQKKAKIKSSVTRMREDTKALFQSQADDLHISMAEHLHNLATGGRSGAPVFTLPEPGKRHIKQPLTFDEGFACGAVHFAALLASTENMPQQALYILFLMRVCLAAASNDDLKVLRKYDPSLPMGSFIKITDTTVK